MDPIEIGLERFVNSLDTLVNLYSHNNTIVGSKFYSAFEASLHNYLWEGFQDKKLNRKKYHFLSLCFHPDRLHAADSIFNEEGFAKITDNNQRNKLYNFALFFSQREKSNHAIFKYIANVANNEPSQVPEWREPTGQEDRERQRYFEHFFDPSFRRGPTNFHFPQPPESSKKTFDPKQHEGSVYFFSALKNNLPSAYGILFPLSYFFRMLEDNIKNISIADDLYSGISKITFVVPFIWLVYLLVTLNTPDIILLKSLMRSAYVGDELIISFLIEVAYNFPSNLLGLFMLGSSISECFVKGFFITSTIMMPFIKPLLQNDMDPSFRSGYSNDVVYLMLIHFPFVLPLTEFKSCLQAVLKSLKTLSIANIAAALVSVPIIIFFTTIVLLASSFWSAVLLFNIAQMLPTLMCFTLIPASFLLAINIPLMLFYLCQEAQKALNRTAEHVGSVFEKSKGITLSCLSPLTSGIHFIYSRILGKEQSVPDPHCSSVPSSDVPSFSELSASSKSKTGFFTQFPSFCANAASSSSDSTPSEVTNGERPRFA